MSPADVRKRDQDRLWVRFYGDGDTIRKRIEPLPDDTMVRINLSKTSFDKGYLRNWMQEHIKVAGRSADSRRPVYSYKLKDYEGEEVKGVVFRRDSAHHSERIANRTRD